MKDLHALTSAHRCRPFFVTPQLDFVMCIVRMCVSQCLCAVYMCVCVRALSCIQNMCVYWKVSETEAKLWRFIVTRSD